MNCFSLIYQTECVQIS